VGAVAVGAEGSAVADSEVVDMVAVVLVADTAVAADSVMVGMDMVGVTVGMDMAGTGVGTVMVTVDTSGVTHSGGVIRITGTTGGRRTIITVIRLRIIMATTALRVTALKGPPILVSTLVIISNWAMILARPCGQISSRKPGWSITCARTSSTRRRACAMSFATASSPAMGREARPC